MSEYRRAIELKPDYLEPHDNLIFCLNYKAGVAPEELLAEACSYGDVVARMATPYTVHGNTPEPDRRLRVGLVSATWANTRLVIFRMGRSRIWTLPGSSCLPIARPIIQTVRYTCACVLAWRTGARLPQM